MNEPALFVPPQPTMPDDVVHPGGGEPRAAREVHNLYGSQMARAAREGLLRAAPRAAAVRDHPRGLRRPAAPRAAVDGRQLVLVGAPVDEHAPAAEPRAARASRAAASTSAASSATRRRAAGPLDRVRASSSRSAATTPHRARTRRSRGRSASRGRRSAGRCSACGCGCCRTSTRSSTRRRAPARRSCARCCSSTPDDETTYAADDEFLLGDALLVAPITRPGIEHRHVYLPAGTWVHWCTGERIEGPAHVLAHAPLGRPRSTCAPTRRSRCGPSASTPATAAPDALTLRDLRRARAPPAAERGLFEDEGEGYGDDARRSVRCAVAGGAATVRCRRARAASPARDRVEVELRRLPAPPPWRSTAPHEAWRSEDGAVLVDARGARRRPYRRPLIGGTVPSVHGS